MEYRDQMIAYLLNEMPESDREAFVERWFTDPELYQQLRMTEAALLDDYIRGTLSDRRRGQVEEFLLGTESQRRKLGFAAALRAAIPESQSFRIRWRPLNGALAALLLAAAGLAIWLGIQNRRLRVDVARIQSSAAASQHGVYTLDIASDTFRGSSSRATAQLSPSVDILRLELELRPGDENRSYSASVSAGGRAVWSEGPILPEAVGSTHAARVWIPTSVLAPGDYSVSLESGGSPVAYYSFSLLPTARR